MEISTFALYGIVEAIVFLLVICVFLLVYIRRSKSKFLGLQENLHKLLATHKRLQQQLLEEREEHSTSNTYKKQINDQLLVTRQYHKGLDAGQDIALDLNPESPKDRQTAAIRHALLVAEKEALNSSSDGTPNWEFLETKFQQLIQFYVDLTVKKSKPAPAADPETSASNDELERELEQAKQSLTEKNQELELLTQDLDTHQKRVGNLEKFKKLFFDMEGKWKDAKTEADLYYQRLQEYSDQVEDQEGYNNLVGEYHNVYSEFELTLQEFTEDGDDIEQTPSADDEFKIDSPAPTDSPASNQTHAETVEIMNSEKQALEELKKLRNLTADQHRLITRLQTQLDEAKTLEEKEKLITELEAELQKQIGFVNEFEACIQLMENELSNAMERLKEVEEKHESAQAELEHVPKMQSTIQRFAQESKEMLTALSDLERKHQELQSGSVDTVETSASPSVNAEAEELAEKLQEELQTLKGQYADLEERYLEAKMQD